MRKERKEETVSQSGVKIGKRSNPDYKMVGVQIPISLHKKARILLIEEEGNKDFSDLMTSLLKDWVESYWNKRRKGSPVN